MSDFVDNNKRIAKNTLFLYFRMILIVIINLFAVRIILDVLGVEEYGIYNIVAGVVVLFSFLGGSLSSGAQRFLAYEIGRKDYEKLSRVFSMTIVVFLCIALLLLILLETVGLWFLNYKMNIPAERMYAANCVFQFSVFTLLMNVMTIPYNAAIIAWERMALFAYISIVEAMSKLICVLVLLFVAFDKLILYSAMIFFISIMLLIVYRQYSRGELRGCQFVWNWNPSLCKSLLSYAGWNMIGAIAMVSRNQGVNIVLNLFFNPVVNAAHTIGQQINGVISQFITNIYMATRPQVTKSYAEGNQNEMWRLVFSSGKFAYFLLFLLCLPVLLEIDLILKIWLGEVPEYTSTIVRYLLIALLMETSVNQIIAVFQAANKLRRYQTTSSFILLLNGPLAYLCLKQVPYVYAPYIISVTLSFVYMIVLMCVAYKEIDLDIKGYSKDVLFKILRVSVLSSILPLLFSSHFPDSYLKLLLIGFISVLSVLVTVWYYGLSMVERGYVKRIVKNIYHKHE